MGLARRNGPGAAGLTRPDCPLKLALNGLFLEDRLATVSAGHRLTTAPALLAHEQKQV